jgi:hypothetical protein
MAGQSRLEQIRASMAGGGAKQVTGSPAAQPTANIQAEIQQRVAQEQRANPQGNS